MSKAVEAQIAKSGLQYKQIDENTLYFPKQCLPKPLTLELNHYYVINLKEYLVCEGNPFQIQWNNGLLPKSRYMKCQVLQFMGKMVRINGSGYDYNNDIDKQDLYYGLWLPSSGITIMSEII